MDKKGDKDKQRNKASRNSPKRSQLKKKESKQNIEPEDEKITQDKTSDEQEGKILNEKLVNPDQIEEIGTLEVKAEVDD